jgi:hypothetical protein
MSRKECFYTAQEISAAILTHAPRREEKAATSWAEDNWSGYLHLVEISRLGGNSRLKASLISANPRENLTDYLAQPPSISIYVVQLVGWALGSLTQAFFSSCLYEVPDCWRKLWVPAPAQPRRTSDRDRAMRQFFRLNKGIFICTSTVRRCLGDHLLDEIEMLGFGAICQIAGRHYSSPLDVADGP